MTKPAPALAPGQPLAGRALPWALLASGATTLLAFGCMLCAALLVAGVAAAGGVQLSNISGAWLLAGAASQQLALLLVLPLALRWFHCSAAQAVPLQWPRLGSLLGALILTLGVAPIASAAAAWVQQLSGATSASELVIQTAAESSPVVFACWLLVVALLPGLAEEMLFRGFILRLFLPRQGIALVVSTVLFAALHGELVQGVGTLLLGLSFGLARLLSGSLWPPVIAHALFNGSMLLLARYGDGFATQPNAGPGPSVLVLCGMVALVGLGLLYINQPGHRSARPKA